ncbi:MAG: cell wall metabolism sensor histidine kinase WalK [Candidatus Omnitrophica bacterium]|nr:cell wall metabolism sensor histidine kinase WalK [Candidatus Omnitrophota bacterium]
MNMEFKKWEKPPKGSKEEKDIVDLIKAFISALKKIPLYPATHPMVTESVLKLFLGLGAFFKSYGDFSLDVFEDKILICEESLDELQNLAKDLVQEFKKISVVGVTFVNGLNEAELESFLKLLMLKPEVIVQRGGMKQILEQEHIEHIVLNEVRFARIKEEEEIVKKDEKGGSGLGTEAGGTAAAADQEQKDNDIVARVSDFFTGKSDAVPDKEVISYQFKKNTRRLVKQILKLIGPEKAVEEVLKIIEERFQKAGFTEEEQDVLVEKLNMETIRLKQPKVTKKDLEKELKLLREENSVFKVKLNQTEGLIEAAVKKSTEEMVQENRKIKREKQRINSVLRHVAEGLVIIDNDGKVLLLNPAAEELFGVSKENKIGQHILEGLQEGQMVSLSKDKHQEFEIELAGSDEKTKKTLRASNAVIESPEGETIGVVSVLSDITKQKELERMKDTFVSNVTHDLRAPLISIQKSISLILESAKEPLPQEQKQFLEIANNSATRLMALVNDLLDVAKLEAGRVPLEYTHVSLPNVVESVFSTLSVWAGSRGVELKKEGLESLEFDADEKLLNQVFTNLVGNAIKFTPAGGSVAIKAEKADKEVKISVIDTGCGIPADSLGRIFEKFEQTRAIPVGNAPKGSGLGLAIVKDIVQLHGGKVWAESEVGKGSAFIFMIPQQKEVLDIRD